MLRSFADGQLFGQTHGSAPFRVLALHGWRRSSADWGQVLAGLDGVALDLPGFGATPAPPEPWGSRRYAEAVAPVLDEMAPGPVVIGHSFGGRVALWLAADHPDQVGGLVLTGVPFGRSKEERGPRPSAGFRLGRALHRAGVLSDARMERLREKHGSADYVHATGVMRQVLVAAVGETDRSAYDDALRTITCSVELVWGDDDTAAPLAVAKRAAEMVSDGRLTIEPAAGHLTPLSAPHALAHAVRRQLA